MVAAYKDNKSTTTDHVINGSRFVITCLNFALSVCFALLLAMHAFTMGDITAPQVFHADRVLQSSKHAPPQNMSAFIQYAFGVNTEIYNTMSRLDSMSERVPAMYEVSGSNSMVRLESVHSNFLLFSAMWIASAFALSMTQVPWKDYLAWSQARLVIVHSWNLLGLVLTMVIFSGTTKWAHIPTSNLFYALVAQLIGWVYQFFYMVECTQSKKEGEKLKFDWRRCAHDEDVFQFHASTFMRQAIYLEFSVVMPLLLVAGMMPASNGIDEWRVQSVLFSSWSLFALLGLYIRFRRTLTANAVHKQRENDTVAGTAAPQAVEPETSPQSDGLDAIGYLSYAILLSFIMLVHALGNIFYSPGYFPPSVKLARAGVDFIVLVAAILVAENLIRSISLRFGSKMNNNERFKRFVTEGHVADLVRNGSDFAAQKVPSFIANMMLIFVGSVTVKCLLYASITNVNGLSEW
jgi:hypothetical protein